MVGVIMLSPSVYLSPTFVAIVAMSLVFVDLLNWIIRLIVQVRN